MDDFDAITEELANGDSLPDHPSHTTSRKIVTFGTVHDAVDGTQLTAGLHRNEAAVLQSGQRILDHAYRYAIINQHIYHTRDRVTIRVQTELVDV